MYPVLLIAVPLLAAFISIVAKKQAKIILSIAVFFDVAYAAFCALSYTEPTLFTIGGFAPPFGINLLVDIYALIGIILLNAVFGFSIWMSFKEIKNYAVVLSVSLAALNGMILTGDLFNLFVFMEIASISAYIITTQNKGFKHTFNYLVLGTLASGLYLFGIAVLYNQFGTLNILHLELYINKLGSAVTAAFSLPIVMIFVGLSVEAKLLPFSGWVRGVLKNANGLVGTLISSAYATAILIVFGRLINSIFIMSDALLIAFTVVATATLVLAEFAAFSKRNLREILLFSSIAQSGLVILLFLNKLMLPAALILVNNVVSKLILFGIAGKIAKDTGTDNIYELKGIFAKYKAVGLGFTVAVMSLTGLPLFFGFIAKANALVALMQGGNIWLPIVILLVSVVEGAYFMRVLVNLWNAGKEGEIAKLNETNDFILDGHVKVSFIAILIAVVILLFGLLPLANMQGFIDSRFLSFLTNILGGV